MQRSEKPDAYASERDKDQGSHQFSRCFEYFFFFFFWWRNKGVGGGWEKDPALQHRFFHYVSAQAITKLEAKPKHQHIHAVETYV